MDEAMMMDSVATIARPTPTTIDADHATDREIRCAVAPSRLGWVLVAATDPGITGIDLGASPRPLIDQLRARFPSSRLKEGDATCAAWATAVATWIEAPGADLDLPLDIQGTACQRRVWAVLRQIPPGRTASYGEVAKRAGGPATAQEVAQACASNPFAVAIPCHRVIRADGRLGGYRWGYGRKRDLLRRESEAASHESGRSWTERGVPSPP